LTSAIALVIARAAYPCSWAVGYFHQVSRLHGIVVGVRNGDWRHMFSWFRHRAVIAGAKMTLYEYRWHVSSRDQFRIVKAVKTGTGGYFDFGELPDGHYHLVVDDSWGGEDWLDVEIVERRQENRVLIDVSPNYPDCSGGHEFLVTASDR